MNNKKMMPLIKACNISKSFPGVSALVDISLEVYPGEVFCLLGDNGAGKSTFIKILSGVFQQSRGDLFFNGAKISLKSSRDAIKLGIMTVYQDLAMFPLMSVERNFIVGSEPSAGWGIFKILDFKKMEQNTRNGLNSIGINIKDISRMINTLSGGERQTVAIARMEHQGAKLLILDEPTSALGVKESAIVLNYIIKARNRGLGIILITHNVNHALAVGDQFAILDHGQLVGVYNESEVNESKLNFLMSGGEDFEKLKKELKKDK